MLQDDNTEAPANQLGRIVVKLPLPPGSLGTLWKNDELYKKTYFEKYPGYYGLNKQFRLNINYKFKFILFLDTADVGIKCEDEYISVLSRADDVINVAGHRLSSSAIEEVTKKN